MDIEGITILSQTIEEVVVAEDGFSMTPLAIGLFCITGIALIGWIRLAQVLIMKDIDNTNKVFLIGIIVAIIGGFCLAGGIVDSIMATTTTYELNTYSVIIADDVSFKEVVDNYNLISRDGEVFVLQEKIPET